MGTQQGRRDVSPSRPAQGRNAPAPKQTDKVTFVSGKRAGDLQVLRPCHTDGVQTPQEAGVSPRRRQNRKGGSSGSGPRRLGPRRTAGHVLGLCKGGHDGLETSEKPSKMMRQEWLRVLVKLEDVCRKHIFGHLKTYEEGY